MTRKSQTLWIIGAIFAAVAIYIAYDTVTDPNLDGVAPFERCTYWSYYKNHGGSVQQCQTTVGEENAALMRSPHEGQVLTPDEMNAVDPNATNLAPTRP